MTSAMEKQKVPLSMGGGAKTFAIVCGILVLYLACLAFLEISPSAILSFPDFAEFFITRFCPPVFTNIVAFLPSVVNTVLFAVVGTYISTLLSFVCGILMCDKTNHSAFLRGTSRAVVSFLRNVPVLVWASILVYIFGIGELVGLLALTIATVGFLSRSYADSIDAVAGDRLEALRSTGAGWGQILWHGIIPEFVPAWVRWTLFNFEINIRASVILGMVGAGGVGLLIQTNIKLFHYQEACAIILLIIVVVVATELITNKLCANIR